MTAAKDLLWIAGASARAAAFSAIRGGISPITADLFADLDLAAQCPAVMVEDYPRGLAALSRKVPAGAPWMYTGALENSPDLVDAIAADRPLWGNPGKVLRAVRDPQCLTAELGEFGLNGCPVEVDPAKVPTDGSWLVKPRRSAGGTRIERWRGELGDRRAGEVYFQQSIEGRACSAVYISAESEKDGYLASGTILLGVTEQLLGAVCPWLHATAFQYAGSLGPLSLAEEEDKAWRSIGWRLGLRFGLVGLWGVDAIVNDAGIWPVEVNPRYTASTEILERAGGFSAVKLHAEACRRPVLPGDLPAFPATCHAKAILFAARDSRVPAELVRQGLEANSEPLEPNVADIPRADTELSAGMPVLTCLARGETREDVLARLQDMTAQFERMLEVTSLL